MAGKRFQQVLSRLKKAVQKVRFLLSFDSRKWSLSSLARSRGSRRLSYRRQPSLLDCASSRSDLDYYLSDAGSPPGKAPCSPLRKMTRTISSLSRSTSRVSEEDDVDRRAEAFIANFYRHIQMERQVSLRLRYCKGGDNKSPDLLGVF